MSEREPIDTSTPWHRKRQEPWTLVDAERAAYERAAVEAMTKPGGGKIHKMSLTTPSYEPNRAMAPDPQSIIAKKGWRPPESNKVRIDWRDKVVVYAILTCLGLMATIFAYVAVKLG